MTFPHTATVERKTKVGTKYTFGAAGSVRCFLQPLIAGRINEEAMRTQGLTFAKSYQLYAPYEADLKDGDKLTIDGIVYTIAGIKSYHYGNLQHKRALLERV